MAHHEPVNIDAGLDSLAAWFRRSTYIGAACDLSFSPYTRAFRAHEHHLRVRLAVRLQGVMGAFSSFCFVSYLHPHPWDMHVFRFFLLLLRMIPLDRCIYGWMAGWRDRNHSRPFRPSRRNFWIGGVVDISPQIFGIPCYWKLRSRETGVRCDAS